MKKMSEFESYSRFLTWFMAMLLVALAAGCGSGGDGGRDPILGTPGIGVPGGPGGPTVPPVAPTVTFVTPVANATGVPINTRIITAAFSKAMDPATLTAASFTLACPAGTPVPGPVTVTYLAAGNIATLTLPAAPNLPISTICTATVTTAAMDTTGLALANNFVWTFTTGLTADATRPQVLSTVPATTIPGPTLAVPTNTAITAAFSEPMDPATITAAGTFTVTGPGVTPVAGAVTYVVGSNTAVFTPAAVLAAGTTYTATITTAATDLAGNQLAGNQAALPAASNYVWTFTTGAGADIVAPTIILENPANLATAVAINSTVNATFSEAMNPLSITFAVRASGPPLGPILAGTFAYNLLTNVATFTPASNLAAGTQYTATITGATDLAGNALVAGLVPNPWTFTTAAGLAPGAPALGTASTFGTFGGSAGMTNQGLLTVINGDIGTTAVSSAVTGFHDAGPGCTYTETPLNVGTVNGTINTAPPPPTVACPTEGTGTAAPPTGTFGIATVARADALAAYNALVATPVVGTPLTANLSGQTVPPGVYVAPGGGFLIQDGLPGLAGDLTLDGLGNANAVWVFKMATTLTVGGPGVAFPRSVILINGAQAKNVFWQVGSAATINAAGGATMVGTIIAQQGVVFSTAGPPVRPILTLNGRALSLNASVTMVNTVINVPAP
jgi:ice-binding like protein/Big-like domain-containing protein